MDSNKSNSISFSEFKHGLELALGVGDLDNNNGVEGGSNLGPIDNSGAGADSDSGGVTGRAVPVSSGHTVWSPDTDVGVDARATWTAKLIIAGTVAVAMTRLQAVGAQSPG